jgi:succinate dehydrogenase / fumarate reductase, flavoprotein subunit
VEKEVASSIGRLMAVQGTRPVDEFHKELGRALWDNCGMARSEASLKKVLEIIPAIRKEFWRDVKIPGAASDFNQEIEKAQRVADFLELAQLLAEDALNRDESCGGHFREEHQTEDGEAKRNDEAFSYVAAWQYQGDGRPPALHKEPLVFEHVHPSQRSYK